jgi:hypothetical protein
MWNKSNSDTPTNGTFPNIKPYKEIPIAQISIPLPKGGTLGSNPINILVALDLSELEPHEFEERIESS